MEHPKSVGDRSTLAIMLALREAGFAVSVPFGENTRYDLIADDGERLLRVQCKSGRLRHGAILFATASTYGHHRTPGQSRRDYQGQIDYFAVYCRATAGVYLVPIADVPGRTSGTLRVAPCRNGQRTGVRSAADYEIARVPVEPREAPAASAGAG